MTEFDNLKDTSYKLIAETIEKNPSNVSIKLVYAVIDKLLEAKDTQIDRLATDKATAILNDIADKAEK